MTARLDVVRDGLPDRVADAPLAPWPLAHGLLARDDIGQPRAACPETQAAAVAATTHRDGRGPPAAAVPTPGPWLVRGEAEADASPARAVLGVEPADDGPGGWPYFMRRDAPVAPGDCPLHIAVGIQRLADARLIAAAPDLAAALLALLFAPALTAPGPDARTRTAVDAARALLVRVAPHLEIGP